MRKAIRGRVTYANVVATLALFVALGGTSYAVTTISGSQINVTWPASTDNIAVAGYQVERCQGGGCSSFAQIATPASAAFNDTGLSASTSYSYRVRAADAAGNLSPYSTTASATTQAPDTQSPSQPGAPTATAIGSGEVDLSWGASTDNVGVTGYNVYANGTLRSSVAGNVLTYTDSQPDTATVSYYVKARDAAGNESAAGNTVAVAWIFAL